MADLVLGLAKSTVEGAVSMVKTAIKEEENLQKGVKRDLILISDEFQMMRSFLTVTRERATDDMSRTLVKQVREMSLDVEDCVECVVQFNKKTTWWLRLLPKFLPAAAPVVGLDEAVANIELLKARVESMGQRNMRYSHIGEHTHDQTMAITAASHLPVEGSDRAVRLGGTVDLVSLINRPESLDDVDEEIKKTKKLQVISVLATSDHIGLMAINKAYDACETSEGFTCRGWVKLMHPFDPHVFMRSLLVQFHENYSQVQQDNIMDIMGVEKLMAATDAVLIDEFKKQINKKYLVVLVDVSSILDYKAAKAFLRDNNNGSCIIVHTQQHEIADMSVGHPHRVSELENADHHPIYLIYKTDKEKVSKVTDRLKAEKEKQASDWLEELKVVGRDSQIPYTLLHVGSLLQRESGCVFSVWGMPGVGKSTHVKWEYYKWIKSGEGFTHFGWVDVSYPFNLKDLSWSLLVDLQLGQSSILGIKDPIQGCREFLRDNRCLVVIDGLRSTDEWDLIRNAVVPRETQSNIFVITNEERVANYCATAYDVYNVKCLEDHHALGLLELRWQESGISDDQMEQAKLLLEKCGGIPQVIDALITQNPDWEMTDDLRLGKLSDRFLHDLETKYRGLEGLVSWMHSYFHSCPDLLKPCLFYVSVFPVNTSIRRRRFLRRWIAEGYSRDTDEEETAERSFTQLSTMNIIQVEEWSWIRTSAFCKINGFFREYIKSRAMEEDLVFALEGPRSMRLKPTGRHLTIWSTWDRDIDVFQSIDHYRLRSLTVSGKWVPYLISKMMRVLRVLDLEGTKGVKDVDVEKMVEWLPRLRFLSLRGCKDVTCLPDASLGGLTLLQTLDIMGTSVRKLPKSIAKLHKLQYIRAGTSGPPIAEKEGTASVTVVESSQPPPAAEENSSSVMVESLPTTTPPPPPPAAAAAASTEATSRPHRCSFLSKFRKARQQDVDGSSHNYGSVMVPREIFGKLPEMHTLGVVNISITTDSWWEGLKLLNRLHKLGVSGINRSNSRKLFDSISGLQHLKSLSVQLDKDNQASCFDDVNLLPPKSLESLKLYGLAECGVPAWINRKDLPLLKKLSLELTPSLLQREGCLLISRSRGMTLDILRIYLTGDSKLICFSRDEAVEFRVLDITCNSRVQAIKFLNDGVNSYIPCDILRIRCRGVWSALQISGLQFMQSLKEVWLSGAYENGINKEHLERQLRAICRRSPPVLRLLKERTS